MSGFDWTAFAAGALAGVPTGALFFAGLALGMRLALRRTRPLAILGLSAMLRISLLLAVGWLVAQAGGVAALAGFGLAFFAARFSAIALARPAAPRPVAPGKE